MDREKVIKCLELCRKLTNPCEGCPYENVPPVENCMLTMHGDALELLKEHEAVKPKSKVRHGANAQIQYFCGNCMTMLHGKPKFCSECGRPVLWEGR
jgi:hypothetical protein